MNGIDPALLWTIAINVGSILFASGILYAKVEQNTKENERLRQDLRDHMKEEHEMMTALTGRMDRLTEIILRPS